MLNDVAPYNKYGGQYDNNVAKSRFRSFYQPGLMSR